MKTWTFESETLISVIGALRPKLSKGIRCFSTKSLSGIFVLV